MKTNSQENNQNELPNRNEVVYILDMGNSARENGNIEKALDWYVKGLQLAKLIQDKPRIQQFSNLILTNI